MYINKAEIINGSEAIIYSKLLKDKNVKGL